MGEKGKKVAVWAKYVGAGSPYLAVFAGLYHLRSAWIAIAIYYAGIGAAILLNEPKSLLRQVLQGFRIRWAFDSAVLCFSVFLLILLRWPHAKLPEADLAFLLQTYGLNGLWGVLFTGMAISINPLLEELFWRGLFMPNPRRPAWADLLFAGFHFFILILAIEPLSAFIGILLLAGFSWEMRAIRGRLGGLAVPYTAHLAADVGIVLAVCIIVRQFG